MAGEQDGVEGPGDDRLGQLPQELLEEGGHVQHVGRWSKVVQGGQRLQLRPDGLKMGLS